MGGGGEVDSLKFLVGVCQNIPFSKPVFRPDTVVINFPPDSVVVVIELCISAEGLGMTASE